MVIAYPVDYAAESEGSEDAMASSGSEGEIGLPRLFYESKCAYDVLT